MMGPFMAGIFWLVKQREMIRTGVRLIAKFAFLLYLLYGAVAWFYGGIERERRRLSLVHTLVAVATASGFSFGIGRFWPRPRPFVTRRKKAWITHKDNPSFPSNHTMNGAVVTAAAFHCHSQAAPFLAIVTLVIGLSRVACRLHYVSDLLGGIAVGLFSYAFTVSFAPFQRISKCLLHFLAYVTDDLAPAFLQRRRSDR